MLALNILPNKQKEVKDEIQVARKGGQCYSKSGQLNAYRPLKIN